MKYRKKPVVIDAIPVAEVCKLASTDWKALPKWVRDAYEEGGIVITGREVSITTLEGTQRNTLIGGANTDMLIRGVTGELYPCKLSIFKATYEMVADDAS